MTAKQRFWAIALGLLVALSLAKPILHSNGESNLYVLQADAFLRGQLALSRSVLETALVDGRSYVVQPPAPAILLMPVVALVGTAATNTHLISLLLGLLSVGVLLGILKRLAVDQRLHFWLVVAFCLGTGYWLAMLRSSGLWFFAHIVAVAFLLLAIFESLGKGRGWLVGLCLGGAFLSRQLVLPAVVFLGTGLWQKNRGLTPPRRLWNWVGFGTALAVCVGGYLLFNYLRFGSPFDTGYDYLVLENGESDQLRLKAFGLFSPVYVPFNFFYFFLQGFHAGFESPDALGKIVMDPFGTSLPAASPFLFVAFYAGRVNRLVQASWLVVGLTLFVQLFYFNNGWMQINTSRYALDFWPVLMVPLALGLQARANVGEERMWQWLIGYAVLLNILAFALAFLPQARDFLIYWKRLF